MPVKILLACALFRVLQNWYFNYSLQVDETDVEPKDIELVMQQANVSKPKVSDATDKVDGACTCVHLVGDKSFEE